MPIFCQKCGARNNDNALVCRVCGTEFSGANGEQKPQTNPGIYLIVMVALVILVAVVLSPLPFAKPLMSSLESKVSLSSVSSVQNYSTTSISNTSTLPNTTLTTSMQPTTTIQRMADITAVNTYISYIDNATNSSSTVTRTSDGFNVTAGSSFPYTMVFTNNQNVSFVIEGIKSQTPGFNVTQVTPSLPELMTPGSEISITSLIKSQNDTSYIGTLTISVYETAYYPANTANSIG